MYEHQIRGMPALTSPSVITASLWRAAFHVATMISGWQIRLRAIRQKLATWSSRAPSFRPTIRFRPIPVCRDHHRDQR